MYLEQTGQSYFDNQTVEYERILENAKKFSCEVCPICNRANFSIKKGKRTCRLCNYQWNTKK